MEAIVKTNTHYFDGIPMTRSQLRMTLLIGLGVFFDIMDNFNFGFVAPALTKSWGLSLTQVGQINSMFFIGMFIGGLSGGFIADRIGRKKTIMTSLMVFSACSVANGLAPSFIPFLISRFLTGIGVASLAIVSVPYLVEMLPGESRGKWIGICMGLGYVGLPVLGVFCKLVLPLGPDAWRWVYLSGGLGFLVFVAGLFWLKESPRWLVSKGRVAEAEKIVRDITGRSSDLSGAFEPLHNKVHFARALREMFVDRNLRNTMVLSSIFMLAYPATFIFINWAPVMLSTGGAAMEDVLSLSMSMSFGMAVGPFLASQISDRGGRKIPIVVITVFMAFLALVYAHLNTQTHIIAVAIVLSLISMAMNAVTLTYLSELYPTHIRSTASGTIYSGGRLTIALVHVIVPVVSARYGSLGVFTLMSGLLMMTAIVTGFWGMRTSGRSLEELSK